MEPARHLEVLSRRAEALLGVAAGAMDARVPACPLWTVADLVSHVGGVWAWAAEVVTTKAQVVRNPAPGDGSHEGSEDRTEEALLARAKGAAAILVAALGSADPEASCWTFGFPPSVRFWFRRQALETALHARDAEGAVGAPSLIDADVAADGVDEHLTVIVPRVVGRRPETWSGETVHLHRTDGEGEWIVRLGPGDEVTTERAHSKGDLALRGSAEALWLWCANRGTAESLGIERFGDEEIAARWAATMGF